MCHFGLILSQRIQSQAGVGPSLYHSSALLGRNLSDRVVVDGAASDREVNRSSEFQRKTGKMGPYFDVLALHFSMRFQQEIELLATTLRLSEGAIFGNEAIVSISQ